MYRAALHMKPTVNGYHSYAPLSYHLLRKALADRDHNALDALATFGPLMIAADDETDWGSFVSDHPRTVRIGNHAGWTLFHLPFERSSSALCQGAAVGIAAIFDEQGAIDVTTLTGGNPDTRWETPHPQRVGDRLVLNLSRATRLCGLVLSTGDRPGFHPRALSVATSLDGVTWETPFIGKMGGAAFLGALENPRDVRLRVPLRGADAQFVALQIEQSHPHYAWSVADIVVYAEP
jgi:hypothetical protein